MMTPRRRDLRTLPLRRELQKSRSAPELFQHRHARHRNPRFPSVPVQATRLFVVPRRFRPPCGRQIAVQGQPRPSVKRRAAPDFARVRSTSQRLIPQENPPGPGSAGCLTRRLPHTLQARCRSAGSAVKAPRGANSGSGYLGTVLGVSGHFATSTPSAPAIRTLGFSCYVGPPLSRQLRQPFFGQAPQCRFAPKARRACKHWCRVLVQHQLGSAALGASWP